MKSLSSRLLSGKRSQTSPPTSSFISSSSLHPTSSTARHHSSDFTHVGGSHSKLAHPISRITFSHGGYAAHHPCQDLYVQVVDARHAFAAAFTSKKASQAASYLQRHLHKEMLRQLRQHNDDIPLTLRAAVMALDRGFRHLHPFNSSILDSVQLAVVWIDFASRTAYMASAGECQVVIGSTDEDGSVKVVAQTVPQRLVSLYANEENEKAGQQPAKKASYEESFLQTLRAVVLEEDVDTVLVGTSGFWREVYPEKALLRLRHFYEEAPQASRGIAAAHLLNFALDRVVQRMRRHADPRFAALRNVSSLQSLHLGEISEYRWGGRQPLRRRRGDVHGDMTLLAFRLSWSSGSGSSTPTPNSSVKKVAKRLRQSLSNSSLSSLVGSSSSARQRALHHWALLRMHFVDYAHEERQLLRRRWFETVDAALVQAHDEQHRMAAAAALLSSRDHTHTLLGRTRREARSRPGSFFAALDTGTLSRWRRGGGSPPSSSRLGPGGGALSSVSLRSGSAASAATSSIGVDSDAESPGGSRMWRPHGPLADVAEPAQPESQFGAHGDRAGAADRIRSEDGDESDVAVELESIRIRQAGIGDGGPLGRTTTYRAIPLERVYPVSSAA